MFVVQKEHNIFDVCCSAGTQSLSPAGSQSKVPRWSTSWATDRTDGTVPLCQSQVEYTINSLSPKLQAKSEVQFLCKQQYLCACVVILFVHLNKVWGPISNSTGRV
jgi:hypothetical protein